MNHSLAILYSILLLGLVVPALMASEDVVRHHDEVHGFALEVPAVAGWSCGAGAYGGSYETQFGCTNEMLKVVLLPWKSSGGDFDLNVQTSFVRAGADSIFSSIGEAMAGHGYEPIDDGSSDSASQRDGARIGFESGGRREVWYLLNGDLLLEFNVRFERDYREGSAHQKARSHVIGLVDSVEFWP